MIFCARIILCVNYVTILIVIIVIVIQGACVLHIHFRIWVSHSILVQDISMIIWIIHMTSILFCRILI
uniref:Uncharacterized protein n=1 Tax=Lepeophtheirus salmonis TaxID=72036 RepID=A0A0K2V148_LEPSM